MDDLQLTKKFEEALEVISNDIFKNHQKYKAAGIWLNEYKNPKKVYPIIENKCKVILDSNFKREDRQESPSFIIPDSVLEICKVLQAVAVVDMDFFPDIEDLISKYKEQASLIPHNFQNINERIATRAKIGKLIEKMYPGYQNHPVHIYHDDDLTYYEGLCDYDGLFVACEVLLEKKERLILIDEDTKLKVCLLTWLIANPDAENANFTITEFQKTKWELTCGNDVILHRAKVIKLLNTCGMLPQWQALACTVITDKANIDETEPKDLIDLAKAIGLYHRSRAQFKRDIGEGKIIDYRKIQTGKHWISKKEADSLYISK